MYCDSFGLARGTKEEADYELTEYVVTRWYRAPEVMCSCQEYDHKIDVWSVGCILAELHGRKPLFPGDDYIKQMNLIFGVLGTPSKEDMKFITNEKALEYIKSLKKKPKISFDKIYRDANPLALDLLDKMLVFNPGRRISVDEALAHPYLKTLHNVKSESECKRMFDFEFEVTPRAAQHCTHHPHTALPGSALMVACPAACTRVRCAEERDDEGRPAHAHTHKHTHTHCLCPHLLWYPSPQPPSLPFLTHLSPHTCDRSLFPLSLPPFCDCACEGGDPGVHVAGDPALQARAAHQDLEEGWQGHRHQPTASHTAAPLREWERACGRAGGRQRERTAGGGSVGDGRMLSAVCEERVAALRCGAPICGTSIEGAEVAAAPILSAG